MIYTSNQITRLTENEEINIPVKDVEYLKIELQPLTDLESGFNIYYVITIGCNTILKSFETISLIINFTNIYLMVNTAERIIIVFNKNYYFN